MMKSSCLPAAGPAFPAQGPDHLAFEFSLCHPLAGRWVLSHFPSVSLKFLLCTAGARQPCLGLP